MTAWASKTPLPGRGVKDPCPSADSEEQEPKTAPGAPGSKEEISSNHINMGLQEMLLN